MSKANTKSPKIELKSKYNIKKITTGVTYTKEYTKFKENSMYPKHTKYNTKLEQNILSEGTNLIPIQVDKNMVIVDGHGRLKICKKHNLLLSYIVVHSDTKTFVKLNECSRKLTLSDKIEIHGRTDSEYKKLFDLLLKYNLGYSSVSLKTGYKPDYVKQGKTIKIDFIVLEEFMRYIRDVQGLSHIVAIKPIADAIAKFDNVQGFSRKHLIKKMVTYWDVLNPIRIGGSEDTLFQLSRVYDHKALKKNHKNMFYKVKLTDSKN